MRRINFRIKALLIILITAVFPILTVLDLRADDNSFNIQLVGRLNLWNKALDVALTDNYAYVATGATGIKVVDISNNQFPVEVSHYDLPNAVKCYVLRDFQLVYDKTEGLVILDIASPTEPSLVTILQDYELLYYDPHLMVAFATRQRNRIDLIDLMSPDNPVVAGHIDIDYYNNPVLFVLQNILYIGATSADNDGQWVETLHIYDVSNPSEPRNISSVDMDRQRITGITGEGELLILIFNNGNQRDVFEIYTTWENIAQPRYRSYVQTADGVGKANLQNSRLYAYGSNGGVFIYDVSIDGEADLITRQWIGEWIYSMQLTDSQIFLIDNLSGLRIIDCRRFPEMIEMGRCGMVGSARYTTQRNNLLVYYGINYVGNTSLNRFTFANVIDPVYPLITKTLVSESGIKVLTIAGDVLYYASSRNPIGLIDCSDLYNPIELETDLPVIPSPSGLLATQGYLFCLEQDSGLYIFDNTDAFQPEFIGRFDAENFRFMQFAVAGRYAYILCKFGNLVYNTILIIDLADASNPRETGRIERVNSSIFTASREFLALYDYNRDGVVLYSLANPMEPVERGFRYLPDTNGNMKISGHSLAILDVNYGLRIIDCSDLNSPVVSGFYDTPGKARNFCLGDDGLFYIADTYNITILDASDAMRSNQPADKTQPMNFALYPLYPNPFNSRLTMHLGLPGTATVNGGLFDFAGRWVMTLVEGQIEAGSRTLDVDATGLAAGLYWVRLEANGEVRWAKVVLMK